MKVIKFEVSFKSDGSVAGLVARQAEGGWAFSDAERQPVESFAAAAVRSLVGTAGGPGSTATECKPDCGSHPRACWQALNHCAAWEPPNCGGQPYGWGWGVTTVHRVWGQMKLGLLRPQGLAVLRWGFKDDVLDQKVREDLQGQGHICPLHSWKLSARHRA